MKPVAPLVLTAVVLACAACASLDADTSLEGSAGYAPASASASVLQPVSAPAADWQHYPYPSNDDDGHPMPPVVVGDP